MIVKLPSLPFPNAFASPCSASLHFVDPFSAPLRPVRVSSSPLLRSRRSIRIVLLVGEGGRGRRTVRWGKRGKDLSPPILLLSFASLSLSLFSSASYSRYAFRHTPRVAMILLPSFVSSFPSKFSPRSLLRFVIFVTVSACPNGKQRAMFGRWAIFLESLNISIDERERDDARRRDAIFTKERKRESQKLPFLPSFFLVSLRLSLYIVKVSIYLSIGLIYSVRNYFASKNYHIQ